jgi:tetratricopeptide (TPR) repeat protein
LLIEDSLQKAMDRKRHHNAFDLDHLHHKISAPMEGIKKFTAIVVISLWTGCATSQKQTVSIERELRLGNHHFKVSTHSKEVQRAFDRALSLTYSFAHHAAEQEYRRAAQLDPNLAMAWWGIALVNGPHINFPMVPTNKAWTAWDALTKANELAPNASELERDLITALNQRYAAQQPEDRKPLDLAYADAMRELWRKYPSNPDIGALFAESMMDLRPWDLWQANGAPQPGTAELVAALEKTLWLNPKHPGANHYYVHAMEASPRPWIAEKSADRLRKLVPDSGHMVHMPAHIYARLGRWDDAVTASVRAMEADKLYRAKFPRPGFYAMYMAHNAHFLGWTAMIQGRESDAIKNARTMVNSVPEDFLRDFGPVVDGYLAFVPEVLMRFGKWQEILDEPKPIGDLPYSQAIWRYTRAAALAALNRIPEARAEQTVFEASANQVPRDGIFGNNSTTNLLQIARLTLAAEIAVKEKKNDEAITNLRQAAAIEDNLTYDEPPDWMQPVRHTLGAVLLRAGIPAEAEMAYREDLQKYPENGWSLFGLAKSLRAQGKDSEARKIDRRFKKAWKRSDIELHETCLCLR